MKSFAPGAGKERELRNAFGRFGTGVTIITAQTAHGPLGMTANSFSSISLDPPLVLWSPASASRRHDAFADADAFCVHVLASEQLPLAMHFASSGDGFDAFEWAPGPAGVPVLANCLTVFHCSTHAIHPAGDHSLILGRVHQVDMCPTNRQGLVFAHGQYGQAAFFD